MAKASKSTEKKENKKVRTKVSSVKKLSVEKEPIIQTKTEKQDIQAPETNPTENEENRWNKLFPKDNVFRLFVEGWQKTLNLRGRTSRYELWSFMLINTIICFFIEIICSYMMSSHFLLSANDLGYSLNTLENIVLTAQTVFYIALLAPIFPIGSLLIRRMHDNNKLAWHNYLEPIFMGVVVLSVLNVTITSLDSQTYSYITMILSAAFITIFYAVCYYSLKFLITTLFYPGDIDKNKHGNPLYKDDEHERLALKFACFYFLIVTTILGFSIALFIIF